MATREKEGMPTGLYVTHPITGAEVEVWVGNYVLMTYGDGAVMGVPAHDERDFAFARKYQLPIRQVVAVAGKEYSDQAWQEWYGDKQSGLTINSGKYDGLSHKEAVDAIAADLGAQGLGEKQTTWRLRDWGISRQRYWGTPIPIIHCPDCGPVPVPEGPAGGAARRPDPRRQRQPAGQERSLPVLRLPQLRKPARRETDTMDTFLTRPGTSCATPRRATTRPWWTDATTTGCRWTSTSAGSSTRCCTCCTPGSGPRSCATWACSTSTSPSPLLCQGMVLNHIYSRKNAQGGIEYFWPEEVENVYDARGAITGAKLKSDGSDITYGGVGTMSKSKNNGVDPQSLIDTLGADTARLFVMFASPPEQTLEWSDSGVEGSNRFLRRLWSISYAQREAVARGWAQGADWPARRPRSRPASRGLRPAQASRLRLSAHSVQHRGVGLHEDAERHRRRQAAGRPARRRRPRRDAGRPLRVLYPVVPHVTWHLWQDLGYAKELGDLLDAPGRMDEAALIADEIELMLQVNGKLRGSIRVAAQAAREDIEKLAAEQEEVARYLEGRPPKRVIVVPGKLVNVVG